MRSAPHADSLAVCRKSARGPLEDWMSCGFGRPSLAFADFLGTRLQSLQEGRSLDIWIQPKNPHCVTITHLKSLSLHSAHTLCVSVFLSHSGHKGVTYLCYQSLCQSVCWPDKLAEWRAAISVSALLSLMSLCWETN